ncbi:MAG TPA: hypothetical protein VEF71_17460 [Streptosporangiaceae bacterium]|nr:hypothetical protein [Streptosporangiaceae bacterium]
MLNRPEFRAHFLTCKDGTFIPARYDQDAKDHHSKENHGWLPRGIDRALQRGMEWVMYPAGLLSGAPRPMSIPMPSGPPHTRRS